MSILDWFYFSVQFFLFLLSHCRDLLCVCVFCKESSVPQSSPTIHYHHHHCIYLLYMYVLVFVNSTYHHYNKHQQLIRHDCQPDNCQTNLSFQNLLLLLVAFSHSRQPVQFQLNCTSAIQVDSRKPICTKLHAFIYLFFPVSLFIFWFFLPTYDSRRRPLKTSDESTQISNHGDYNNGLLYKRRGQGAKKNKPRNRTPTSQRQARCPSGT